MYICLIYFNFAFKLMFNLTLPTSETNHCRSEVIKETKNQLKMETDFRLGIVIVLLFCISACVAAPASAYNGWLDNLEERADLFEGDILLDPNRNGLIGEAYRWPNRTVIYNISAEFSVDERIKILTALAEIVNTTCLLFRQRTNETNYVFIQRGAVSSGCFSSVGRIGGRQILNLEPSCVPRHGTVVHEMIHTIGFYHEQARPDRDDYVTIVWDKIQPGKEHNFIKYEYDKVSTFGQPYNYGSVMHYSAYGFSTDGSATIIPNDPEAVIGQRVGISKIDADKINIMYGCA